MTWQSFICYIGLIRITLLQVESYTIPPSGHYATPPRVCCGIMTAIMFTLLLTRSQHVSALINNSIGYFIC